MLKNTSVKLRLIIFAAIMFLFIGAIGAIGYYYLHKSNEEIITMYNDRLIPIKQLNAIRAHLRAIEGDMLYLVLKTDDTSEHQEYLGDINQRIDEMAALWNQYKTTELLPYEEERIPKFDQAYLEDEEFRAEVLKEIQAGDKAGAELALEPYRAKLYELNILMKELTEFNEDTADVINSKNSADYKMAVSILICSIIAALSIAIVIAGLIITSIIKPIAVLKKELDNLVERGGDLTKHIEINSKDEIGALALSTNSFLHNLREIISGIITESNSAEDAVDKLNLNIVNLNGGVEDVSATTEELSATMEETAASTEEMNATSLEIERAAQSIAEKAEDGARASQEIHRRANKLTEEFTKSIEEATSIFENVRANLESALEKAQAVNQIDILSDAILQITSQTNLLALNAAIEAARAGEAGKGFAVVADEIRKLAEDSKNTVTQIQEVTAIVTDSVKNLSSNAAQLLDFVNTKVTNDYNAMLDGAKGYQNDAVYLDELIGDFSATSEELLSSIINVIQVIEEVTNATSEGANGTANIANKTSEIVIEANGVVKQADNVKQNLENVIERVSKFEV